MTPNAASNAERLFGRILDGLASHWATVVAVVIVFGIAASSYSQLQQGSSHAIRAQELFHGPSVRSNAIALTDIQRLQQAALVHATDAMVDPDSQRNLSLANDILYARAENFERNLQMVPPRRQS